MLRVARSFRGSVVHRRSCVSRPIFANVYGVLSRRAERGPLGERRRALVAQLSGRVLDMGAGTGETFKHVPALVDEVVALEPDRTMVRQARPKAAQATVPVRLVRGVGERLPFPAATFDGAVVALVLCTVEDPRKTLAELRRVLRPDARLYVMEHVRADDSELAAWQDRMEVPWAWFNGGCRPNRPILKMVEEAGFRVAEVERYGFPVLPHVQAVAVRL